jgi:hypothetical protein
MSSGNNGLRLSMVVASAAGIALAATGCGMTSASASRQSMLDRPRVPVVSCRTGETQDLAGRAPKGNATWVWVYPRRLPKSSEVPASVPAQVATHLARYEGDIKHARDMDVLAPRGWKCTGHIPEDGNWDFVVAPAGQRAGQKVDVRFRWAGAGASLACEFFPSARAHAPQPSVCHAPARTVIKRRTSHLVAVVTRPAHGSLTSRGFVYWYAKATPSPLLAEATRCVLPPSEGETCAAILSEARQRQGRELAP